MKKKHNLNFGHNVNNLFIAGKVFSVDVRKGFEVGIKHANGVLLYRRT